MKKNEIANRVKELILMPPPKPLTRTKSETSDDLRRNLMETATNIQDNNLIQEVVLYQIKMRLHLIMLMKGM